MKLKLLIIGQKSFKSHFDSKCTKKFFSLETLCATKKR